MDVKNSTSVRFVQEACGVSEARAVELLQAASGSADRAVDIYFHQQQQQPPPYMTTTSPKRVPPTSRPEETKRPKTTTVVSDSKKPTLSPCKQASLSFFFERKGQAKGAAEESRTEKRKKDDLGAINDGDIGKEETLVASPSKFPKQKNKQQKDAMIRPQKRTTSVASSVVAPDDPRLHYAALAKAFSEMASTTKRLAKLDALQRVYSEIIHAVGGIGGGDVHSRRADGQVLQYALELTLGNVGSTTPLQVSGAAVSKAILAVTAGVTSTKLREAYRATGDLGDAAIHFVRNQQTLLVEPRPLTLVRVHETLRRIASQQGKGSQNQRHALMVQLLRSCNKQSQDEEMRFLVRTLLGNMRLGANVRTVLAALAMAVRQVDADGSLPKDDAVKIVQETFDFCPRLDKIALALLCGGVRLMQETCVLQVGTPVHPMLANPAHSLEQVEKLMQGGGDGSGSDWSSHRTAVAEYKYDGMRCQAHFFENNVTLYSRHMLDITEQFPDAVRAFLRAKTSAIESFIVDSEIVGVEKHGKDGGIRLLPFQDLSTRRGASEEHKKNAIQICIFAFDLIYLNGQSIANKSLYERQAALRRSFFATDSFSFAASMTLKSYNEAALRAFLEKAVRGGAEGLMVKLTGEERNLSHEAVATTLPNNNDPSRVQQQQQQVVCGYESGARSQTWLKVKRDYVQGYSDTIDVVPIGAWYGTGRKASKGFLSPVLLAVYDDEEDVYRSISRCMSFTDAMYQATKQYYFRGTEYPADVGMDGDTITVMDTATETIEEERDGESNDKDEDDNDTKQPNLEEQESRINCYPSRPTALVVTNENPPIWFKPSEVWEVSFADLTLSKTHSAAAGLVDASRGVALRFPRFKRRRPDKRIDQATTSLQIAQLFSQQSKQGASHSKFG